MLTSSPIYLSDATFVSDKGVGYAVLRFPSAVPEQGFTPLQLISDRKLTKSMSAAACYGLAAAEQLSLKYIGDAANESLRWRTGIYLGVAAPSIQDKSNYEPAIRQSQQIGSTLDYQAFGKSFMQAPPFTGLIGLPNALLCFAGRSLSAYGVNGAFVGGEMASVDALASASRALVAGRCDICYVGGFSAPQKVSPRKSGAMLRLETKQPKGASIRLIGSLSLTTHAAEFKQEGMHGILQLLLKGTGIRAADISDVIFCSKEKNALEEELLDLITDTKQRQVEVFAPAREFGPLAEASGVGELALYLEVHKDNPQQRTGILFNTDGRRMSLTLFNTCLG